MITGQLREEVSEIFGAGCVPDRVCIVERDWVVVSVSVRVPGAAAMEMYAE